MADATDTASRADFLTETGHMLRNRLARAQAEATAALNEAHRHEALAAEARSVAGDRRVEILEIKAAIATLRMASAQRPTSAAA